MYNIKISKDIHHKTYFAYLYRCLKYQEQIGKAKISFYDNQLFQENYYELIYINDYPVFFDLRDDIRCDKDLKQYFNDFIVFKGNYSSEFWTNAEKGIYPNGFEYKLKESELKFKDKIKPFALGRALGSLRNNEMDYFKTYHKPIKYDIVSYTGSGIYKLQTDTRLKLFDMINDIFREKSKLMFRLRGHYLNAFDYSEYVNKYKNDISVNSYCDYISFISSGQYSINTSGLCLSTPFRFVDAILSNRCVISTKVWHDIYDKFPCVKLPICGYLGTGDWNKAKNILENLNEIDYNSLLSKSKDIYSWYLSAKGMWDNQIINQLNGEKICQK